MSQQGNNASNGTVDDTAPHILVIDDDKRIRDLIARFLFENGFRVSLAQDAQDARNKLQGIAFDLLIVDVMMPGESGVELTRSISATNDTPILMLTALAEVDARIEGLEAGADDYLAKPFDPRELLLRINSILKRVKVDDTPVIDEVNFGEYTFNLVRRELLKQGTNIRLTERETDFMVILSNSAGETVPRHALTGDDNLSNERTVDVQINRLRRKLENDPANPIYLQTVRGIGYRLRVES
jgi:two-component system phosphate regulon response regulator OmpR